MQTLDLRMGEGGEDQHRTLNEGKIELGGGLHHANIGFGMPLPKAQPGPPPGLELKEEVVEKFGQDKAWMCMKCFVSVGGRVCQGCGGEEPDFIGMVDGIINHLE
ncbi:hypothetical protein TrCOL_g4282 [Triparma columacea]|uniref:Uncharacterized protein n=1 Tax=Triparma columacea TaxID=722753 RepID=A0A9W7LAK0_9STRA|nr:hypothetical protein TrCOL_g4282 [Triparma columacea]